jgi:hypothetical protein
VPAKSFGARSPDKIQQRSILFPEALPPEFQKVFQSAQTAHGFWSAPRKRGRIILSVIVALPLVAAHSLWIL